MREPRSKTKHRPGGKPLKRPGIAERGGQLQPQPYVPPPHVSFGELQKWLKNIQRYSQELSQWNKAVKQQFDLMRRLRAEKATIPPDTAEFLSVSFTAIFTDKFPTMESFIHAIRTGDWPILLQFRESLMACKSVWDEVLAKWLSAARKVAMEDPGSKPQKAYVKLRKAHRQIERMYKEWWQIPSHRPPEKKDRDRKVRELRLRGNTYGQIAKKLGMTEGQAERADKRYLGWYEGQLLELCRIALGPRITVESPRPNEQVKVLAWFYRALQTPPGQTT